MKKTLLFGVMILMSLSTFASHLMGGYIQTTQRGYTDTVDIWVTLFSDPQGVNNPNTITVSELKMVNSFYQTNTTISMTRTSQSTWQGMNVDVYYMSKVLTSGDYRFIYTNCCRGSLTNSTSGPNSNFTISLDYKKTAAGTVSNSAPILVNYLPVKWVVNDTASSILFAVDLDGDSVRVVMDDAINQHANNVFVPIVPFSQLNSYGHYQVQDDGTITWGPTVVGTFATGYKVEEYRNGSLIGTNRVQQVYVTSPGSTPSFPWAPIMINYDLINGDSVQYSFPVSNASSTSMVIPGVTINQVNMTTWDLTDLQIGTYRGVLRASSNSSNNDYYFTFTVRSTIGMEELSVSKDYEVWDWMGNYLGKNIEWNKLHGFYILRYDDGRIEKTFVD